MKTYRNTPQLRLTIRVIGIVLGVALAVGARHVCLLLGMKAGLANTLLGLVFLGVLIGVRASAHSTAESS